MAHNQEHNIIGGDHTVSGTPGDVIKINPSGNGLEVGPIDSVTYVDDFASLPLVGNEGELYITKDYGREYRWTGTNYVQLLGQVNNIYAGTLALNNIFADTTIENVVSSFTSLSMITPNNQSKLGSLTLNELVSVGRIAIENNPNLLSISIPELVNFFNLGAPNNFKITGNNQLTSINLESLTAFQFGMGQEKEIQDNPLLTSINLNSLQTIAGTFDLRNNDSLPSFTLPSYINGGEIFVNGNAILESLNFPSAIDTIIRVGNSVSNPLLNTISVPFMVDGTIDVLNSPLTTLYNPVHNTGSITLIGTNLPALNLTTFTNGSFGGWFNELATSIDMSLFNTGVFNVYYSPLVTDISLPAFVSGSVTVQQMFGLTNISLPLYEGIDAFNGECIFDFNQLMTSLNLPSLTAVSTFNVSYGTGLTTLSVPALTNVNIMYINNNDNLPSLSMNALVKAEYAININNNTSISTISLTSYTEGGIQIVDNSSLTSVNIGAWTADINVGSSAIQYNPLLTNIIITSFNQSNYQLYFDYNALSAASISQMLVDFDTNGATDCYLSMIGGTNADFASLTGAGATAHANLLTKNWTIVMN